MADEGASETRVSRRSLLIGIAGITLVSACGTSSALTGGGLTATPSGSPAKTPRAHQPPPGLPSNPVAPIYSIPGQHEVALTVDDGPDPVWTPRILEVLAKHDVRATYCMIGYRAKEYPRLVQMVRDAGHSIANHTWDHKDLTRLNPDDVYHEISHTNNVLADGSGAKPEWFRAPFGSWNKTILGRCQQLNLKPLAWSVDPRDWSAPGAARIVSQVLKDTRAGSVILEHDGGGNRAGTAAALDQFLPVLKSRGLKFVTL